MDSCLNYAERLLEQSVKENPNKPFLVYEGEEFSFEQAFVYSQKIAEALRSLGLKNLDRVALSFYNEPQFVFAYFGILLAGGVAVPISPALSPSEVSQLCLHSATKLLLSNRTDLESVTLTKLLKEKVSLSEGKPVEEPPRELAVIIYTSGTTGDPKGVMLTYSNVEAQVQASGQVLGLQQNDSFLGILSMSHVFGQMDVLWAALEKGCTVCLIKQFEVNKALEALVRNQVSIVIAVPTMYRLMIRSLKQRRQEFPKLRLCHSGAAPMPSELFLAVESEFKAPFQEGYGLTETCSMAFSNPLCGPRKLSSVGKTINDVKAKIVDENNHELTVKEIGEVCIKGKIITPGYFNNSTTTKNTIDSEGWLHTGDLGYFDEDGYLFLVDRKKDLIIRSGCKIYPHEVEVVLRTHPMVEEVAVLGVENDLHGQKVKACIVPVSGKSFNDLQLIDELRTLCLQKLAKFKVPTYFQVVKELPKTHSGKIQRRRLMS